MDIIFRQAVCDDIPVIKELFSEMLRSVGEEEADNYDVSYLEFFSDNDDIIYAAEADGKVIGYLSVAVFTEYIYLDDFSVTEKYRGKGIGTKLIALAEKYGIEKKIPTVMLHVKCSNEKALRLYKRLGYTVSDDNGSRFRMTKQLQR